MSQPQTLVDKFWAAHEIVRREDGNSLLWIDRHYVHEGSFHAFSQMNERDGRSRNRSSPSALPITTCRRAAAQRHRQSRDRPHGAGGRGQHGRA